ncbi:5'-nucleotidase domain-containing protein 1 [Metopolophium dirhodum]|uniref:5'-nucleotidase domain-containing protein 1 n=1 Tax=Metopolophium dirhodum TaxID=44670 RepID=UPI00298FA146|nr:5'-nucleotidase domain-containing protein 1 [Metopolophium dirhodum]
MPETFKLSDYDCVGFDLDNTLCEYRIGPMVQMIYDVLIDYLIKNYNYSDKHLRQPIDFDFFQRGLFLDAEKGNILKINGTGQILRAAHGTNFMSDEEIMSVYGPNRTWTVTDVFVENFLETWNGPMSEKIRPLLDFFDIPVSLVFGRCIDSIDNISRPQTYNVWPDVLKGLIYMYSRENFSANTGDYFPYLKSTPSLYYNKCPDYVLNWLKELKQTKKVFLISGSHVDYANFTATQSLGENWKELFDIAVFYSRKPGFFTTNRPFYNTDSQMLNECDLVDNIQFNNIYSQGNWDQLHELLKKETGKSNPKCLYVGDNILQDVVAPAKFSGLDTIAVVEEMKLDSNDNDINPDNNMLRTNKWSSYLVDCDKKDTSIWTSFIANHGKLCIPSIKNLAKKPINFEFTPFTKNKITFNGNGFFPFIPNSLYKILK